MGLIGWSSRPRRKITKGGPMRDRPLSPGSSEPLATGGRDRNRTGVTRFAGVRAGQSVIRARSPRSFPNMRGERQSRVNGSGRPRTEMNETETETERGGWIGRDQQSPAHNSPGTARSPHGPPRHRCNNCGACGCDCSTGSSTRWTLADACCAAHCGRDRSCRNRPG